MPAAVGRRGAVVLVAFAALLAPSGRAAGEEPPWRFSVVRPEAGFVLGVASGGVDLTGDGVDDVVAGLRRRERGAGVAGDPVAQVVSGVPRDSWVAEVDASELVVRGIAAADNRPVPFGCVDPLEDVDGDGIGELVVVSCTRGSDYVEPRMFVVFGSAEGGEVRLAALGGAGFEVDLSPLAADDQLGAVVALADVDGRGSPGLAALLLPSSGSEPEEGQVRVSRLSGEGAQLWAVYEGRVGDVRSAGDFHADGSSDLLVSDYDEEGLSVLAVRLPGSADTTPRRLGDLGGDAATRLRRHGRSQGDSVEPGGSLPGIEFNGVGDLNADGYDDVIVGTGNGGGSDSDSSFGRAVLLGGPTSGSEPREEFTVDGGLFGYGSPPVPAGDLNGDGIDDLLIHRFTDGVHVVYGSRTVEPVSVGLDGPRETLVYSPLFAGSYGPAPIGGRDGRGQVRVTVGSEQGLLVFEPPQVPPRDGVAFDGDPATVRRVDGDPVEVSEATAVGQAEAVARSLAVSRRSFAGSRAEHVVVASAAGLADALAASPLLGGGPLLLTPRDVLPDAVFDELDRVLVPGGTVYVMGGTAAVGETVTTSLAEDCPRPSRRCYRVQRVAGATRVETAAAVARLVGATGRGEVAVARAYGTPDGSGVDVTGAGWADAVTAGGWAAATGTPVLLTPSGEGLHPAVADAVAELGVSSTVVLGGTAAVSEQAAAQLPGVRRVAGRDRSETAVAVAEQLWPPGTTRRVLVDGYREDGWTAGLPAAALAADGDAPLLLSDGNGLPPATAAALRACPPDQADDVLLLGAGPANGDPLPGAVLAAQRC